MGSGYIAGPVYAGVSYQCILTTTNSNGSNLFTTEMIIPINGMSLTIDFQIVLFTLLL